MINPNLDGTSHVNIYSQGQTELGKMLSNFYRQQIQTKDGQFNSVEGYWFWLGIEDCKEKEVLRQLYGYNAKKIGTQLKKIFPSRDDAEFERKILTAIWYKFKRNTYFLKPELIKLPFEHYYNFGGKVVDVKDKYRWMIGGIEKMREYIVDNDMVKR